MATMQDMLKNYAAELRRQGNVITQMRAQYAQLMSLIKGSRSITEEIDSIVGRRLFYTLSDRLEFDITNDGLRSDPLSFLISQDGPFVATHYPLVVWKPNAPNNCDHFGQWSPVTSWPLPLQQSTNQDRIDLSYEVQDSGSQRNFQNEVAGPVFSRPDNFVPLPVPTLFSPNSTIQFFPTFEDIFFDPDAEVPVTGGELSVNFIGYKIVNL